MMATIFSKVKTGLQRLLNAQAHEITFLLLLLLTNFLLNVGADMVDNVAEMIFVRRVGPEQLPTLFAIAPIVIVVVLLFIGQVLDRVNHYLIFVGTTLVFILFLALTYLFIFSGGTGVYYVLYVVQRTFFVISNIMFWLVANDLVDINQAKRLFAPIIATGIGGKLIGNLLTAVVVTALPAESVLLLAGGVFGSCMGTILWLRHLNIPTPEMNSEVKRPRSTEESISFFLPRRTLSLPFVQAFIWLTVIVSVGDTILRYEFNTVLNQSVQSEQNLIIAYSLFKTGAGVLVLIFQLLGAGFFLRQLSVAGALNVQPVATIGGFFLIGLVPQLFMVASVFGVLSMLHFGFYTSGRKIVVNIFPMDERGRFSAFTKQLVYLGKLLGALFLFLVANHVSLVFLNWLAIGAITTWFFFLPRFNQHFDQACIEMQGSDSNAGNPKFEEPNPL